jgi:hypothetical protein
MIGGFVMEKMNQKHELIVNYQTGFVYDTGWAHWSPEAGGYVNNETGQLECKTPLYVKG